MANILDTNPNDLMENFQSAYYDQIGRRMQIGSEEYTLSSIYTYVLSMYAGLINNSYKNQLIESANGVFLDNLAAKYNLKRTPDVYSNPWFEGYFYFNSACEFYNHGYQPGMLEIDVAGHKYINYNAITLATTQVMIRFIAIDAHNDHLNHAELIAELKKVKDSQNTTVFITSALENGYIKELESVPTALSDEDFRKYINESKYLYVPGVAGSFEALAKASSDNLSDVRCRVQNEAGFIPGNVDIFCKPKSYETSDLFRNMVEAIDIPKVADVIAGDDITVIGQTVNVYAASRIEDSRTYNFFIPEAYNMSEYIALYVYKFKAVCGYLNNHSLKINEPFLPSMVLNLMMKPLSEVSDNPDDYGYTASDGNVYTKFDQYKDLPIVGLSSISDYTKRDCNPAAYVYLKYNAVGFLAI